MRFGTSLKSAVIVAVWSSFQSLAAQEKPIALLDRRRIDGLGGPRALYMPMPRGAGKPVGKPRLNRASLRSDPKRDPGFRAANGNFSSPLP